MSRKKSNTRYGIWLSTQRIILIAALVGVWQLIATLAPAPYMPPIQDIGRSFLGLIHGELLIEEVLPSVYRVTIGFLLGVAVGSIVGLAIGYFRRLDPWVRPVLEFARAIPAVAILPGALLLFGATDFMRVAVIAFGATFPVLLSAVDGARRVDQLLIDTARINGQSQSQILWRVILPAALPQIFAGIRISLGLALIMMVISELMAANNGLGFFIQQNQRLFNNPNVYAGVAVIGILAWLFTTALLQFEKSILKWHIGWRGAAE